MILQEAEEKYGELIKNAETLKEEVDRQLTVTTAGTLASAFDERQRRLRVSTWLWLGVSALILYLLNEKSVFLVDNTLNSYLNNPVALMIKFSITFPLLFALGLAVSFYKKERDLEEEYAFKSAVALSLGAYQKLLKDELAAGGNERVLHFIVESITGLYSSPTQRNLKVTKKEKDILNWILDMLKEAKQLVPTNP